MFKPFKTCNAKIVNIYMRDILFTLLNNRTCPPSLEKNISTMSAVFTLLLQFLLSYCIFWSILFKFSIIFAENWLICMRSLEFWGYRDFVKFTNCPSTFEGTVVFYFYQEDQDRGKLITGRCNAIKWPP